MAGSIVPLPIMLEDEEDRKLYEQLQPPTSIVTRYGHMKLIAELPYDGNAKPGCGSKLVIRTHRGTELAEMLTTTCANSGCSKSVSRKQMMQYIENSGGKDFPFTDQGRVLRVATVDDMLEQAKMDEHKGDLLRFSREMVREMDLPLRIVEVEQLLGGERIIFHYTSDDWVDFRELVRLLAKEYQTRIEMHQVNARDEARLVGDYERCGQHCCCKQFLKVLKPVSMRSAKVQKATLDPTKISGRCGRLMCCLRYEDQTYESLRKRLPYKQTRVSTPDGEGVVLDTQILTQLVLVRVDNSEKAAAYPLENITVLERAGGGGGKGGKPRESDRRDGEPEQTQSPDRQPAQESSDRAGDDESNRAREAPDDSDVDITTDDVTMPFANDGGSSTDDGAPDQSDQRLESADDADSDDGDAQASGGDGDASDRLGQEQGGDGDRPRRRRRGGRRRRRRRE